MLDSTRRPCRRVASTDINSLLVQILDATQPILAARNVELRTDLADQLPTIAVDVDQMQQVFINLVNNGLDAMPSGGVLSISTKPVEDSVAIEMSDTGEGIPSERINLVFDPLYSTKRGRGTGLGLTIVKQIVQEHSGAVSVTSRAGSGATFRVMLPLSTGEDAVASEAYRQAEAPGSSPAGGDKL
jgi:two-component system NtrC family sensor kinase